MSCNQSPSTSPTRSPPSRISNKMHLNCRFSVDEKNRAKSLSFTVLYRRSGSLSLRLRLMVFPCPKWTRKRLTPAEAIGDLFVKNRVLELRAALDVISIEAAYGRHDRVDCALTQVAFVPPGSIS